MYSTATSNFPLPRPGSSVNSMTGPWWVWLPVIRTWRIPALAAISWRMIFIIASVGPRPMIDPHQCDLVVARRDHDRLGHQGVERAFGRHIMPGAVTPHGDAERRRDVLVGGADPEVGAVGGPGLRKVEHCQDRTGPISSDSWSWRDSLTYETDRSTSRAILANIALATKSRLDWDAQAERFTNNDAANELLDYEYRKPWSHIS